MRSDDNRFREMMKGRRAVRIVPIPDMEDDPSAVIGLRVLSEEEAADARAGAIQYAANRAKTIGLSLDEFQAADPLVQHLELQRQLLCRACVCAEPDEKGEHKQFFLMGTAEMRKLDTAYVQALYGMYTEHQELVSPLLRLDQAAVEEMVDALGKGLASQTLLSRFEPGTVLSLARTLASRLGGSRAGKSSDGSSSETPTSPG